MGLRGAVKPRSMSERTCIDVSSARLMNTSQMARAVVVLRFKYGPSFLKEKLVMSVIEPEEVTFFDRHPSPNLVQSSQNNHSAHSQGESSPPPRRRPVALFPRPPSREFADS